MQNERLPSYYYRTEHCYRPFGYHHFLGILGCGFMLKRGISKDHINDYYSHYALVYVLRGSGEFIDDSGRTYQLGPGSVFQRSPRYKHTLTIDPDSDWAECFIGIKYAEVHDDSLRNNLMVRGCEEKSWRADASTLPDFTLQILEHMHIIDVEKPVFQVGLHHKLVKQFDDLLTEMKNSTPRKLVKIQLSLLDLLHEISSGNHQHQTDTYEADIIQKICHLISVEPANRTPFPVLLDGVGLSYSRLRTLFKQKMGISLEKYRIMQRIQHSCDLLSQGKMNIGEVAHEMGYKDQFAFSTQFKKVTGMSPKEFQKQFL